MTMISQLATALPLAHAAPAGGAALGDVILATGAAMIVTTLVVATGWAHRTGRISFLGRLATRAAEQTGAPVWAALPSQVAAVSLLCALFGMYWDISLHIDNGRDPGPLANPAHYFILAGLFGVFMAGFLATVLPEGRPSRWAVRIAGDWYAPVGALVLLACGSFALLAFPLDDVWHRFFGQDVTLWGPTHLMMIGGAGLALLGNAALLVEGEAEARSERRHRHPALAALWRIRYAAAAGGLLIGLSTFQGEFDFGVPQFRLVFEPVMIAAAAGIGLVAARIYGGRGSALYAAAFFIVVRGAVSILVGPVLGQTMPHFPLYVAEALLVEGAALARAPRARPYAFGALSGLLIGTVGFAAEYAWSQLWMPIAWPSALIAESAVVVPVAAIAAGLIGAFVGAALAHPRAPQGVAPVRLAPAAAALAAIVLVFAYGLRTSPEQDVRARVALHEVTAAPERTVGADVRISPPSAAVDADWLNATAWQGGGLQVDALRRVGLGEYRTTQPLPVHGDWKAMVRLHHGDSIVAIPIYLPNDPAIPAREVPARARFTRAFVPDHQILQREQKGDVPAGLPLLGYSVVAAIVASLLATLGWTLARLGGPQSERDRREETARARLATGATGGPT